MYIVSCEYQDGWIWLVYWKFTCFYSLLTLRLSEHSSRATCTDSPIVSIPINWCAVWLLWIYDVNLLAVMFKRF